jgi:hypothetical protein
MDHDSIPRQNAESPIGDIAYPARSEHRVSPLVALTERPRSRSEICELAGVSTSTIRRTLDDLEFAAEVSDRVCVMVDGTIVSSGPPREVF